MKKLLVSLTLFASLVTATDSASAFQASDAPQTESPKVAIKVDVKEIIGLFDREPEGY
ncbi:hypothetical protein QL992_10695 [Microbacterium sp. APC 3898]|uniref:Uncharacterized protein n=2 Tax=Planococcus TaxID=1372 RepID=A0ABT7ZJV1_9BACL|nr:MULTISPECIES: hypothetical protein [Terrabacteria group]MBD8014524.1 hypothetical protein [Planococcus wigleyi]MDN3427403.1 hypothetical protein [Planococcus sp. APC 4016]MDN3436752.1 hypothetical protein [Planococcus sp. APC 3900]MDN3499687.1 hypothetical protein [Microbacterium sp. APC 3898]